MSNSGLFRSERAAQKPWSDEETITLAELASRGYTQKALAQHLGRNTKSVENKVMRLQRSAPEGFSWMSWVLSHAGREEAPESGVSHTPPAEAPSEVAPAPYPRSVETETELHDYRLIGDKYLFVVDRRLFEIERDRMEKICADYSEQGGGMTQAEVARRHGLPLPILQRILRAYSHFKTSVPFTRERVAEAAAAGELDALADNAVEVAEHALQRKIAEAEITRMRLRLKELESQEYRRAKVREAAVAAAQGLAIPPALPKEHQVGIQWNALVVSTDEHAGKGSDSRTTYGPGYSTEKACRRLMLHADYTADWIRREGGVCDTIFRCFLGDILEAFKGTTLNGTHLKTDLKDSIIWGHIMRAIIYSINALRPVCRRVVIRAVPGNHDGDLVPMLFEAVSIAYEMAGIADVEFVTHHLPYDSFLVGDTLHMLDHGRGYGNLTGFKAKTAAETNAREIGGELFAQAKWIYTYVGHLHEDQVASLGGHHKLIRLPAFCDSNDFETMLRLPGEAGFRLFRLDDAGRHFRSEERLFSQIDEDGFLTA